MVQAVVHGIQLATAFRNTGMHFGIHLLQHRGRELALGDSRLVGDTNH
jgi:hypothetical protein